MIRRMRNFVLFSVIAFGFSVTTECYTVSAFNGNIDSRVHSNSNSSKLIENPSNILVLVNKTNALSKDYVPKNLVMVNAPSISGSIMLRKEAARSVEEMLHSAKKDGITLKCSSGYRTYNIQAYLYNKRVREIGKERAEKYVATAGNSEHQTGLAVDIMNKRSSTGRIPNSFGETKEGKWLKNNAFKFGFILRYPKGKEKITEVNYEPWHFRYVGAAAAKRIEDNGITLEEYLKQSN